MVIGISQWELEKGFKKITLENIVEINSVLRHINPGSLPRHFEREGSASILLNIWPCHLSRWEGRSPRRNIHDILPTLERNNAKVWTFCRYRSIFPAPRHPVAVSLPTWWWCTPRETTVWEIWRVLTLFSMGYFWPDSVWGGGLINYIKISSPFFSRFFTVIYIV